MSKFKFKRSSRLKDYLQEINAIENKLQHLISKQTPLEGTVLSVTTKTPKRSIIARQQYKPYQANTLPYSPIILQALRDIERLYQDPRHQLIVVEELIRHMADFRYQTFGPERHQAFCDVVKQNPHVFRTPITLRAVYRENEPFLGCVQRETGDKGLIFLNIWTLDHYLKSHTTMELMSLLESAILHEWVTKLLQQI